MKLLLILCHIGFVNCLEIWFYTICKTLVYEIFVEYGNGKYAWSKEIWDIVNIAYLINPKWVPTNICPSPILTSEVTWSLDPSRHFTRVAIDANRDAIFVDLFRKLEKHSSG